MDLSKLLKITRQYFWNLNFTEVEIPYLNPNIPNEPNIYPFSTIWTHTGDKFYLPTSPEMALKKHLSTHKTNCFAVSHCFRDLESAGPHHTPEFLMLEWYEIGQTYLELMDSVKKYISQFIDIKFTHLNLPQNLPDNEPDFNQFFLNQIEPTLPRQGGVFITGYPSFLSPLASSNNNIANRFELYLNGIEIANGCTENIKYSQLKPYLSTSIIKDFSNIPSSAGVGLGINRLLSFFNSVNV